MNLNKMKIVLPKRKNIATFEKILPVDTTGRPSVCRFRYQDKKKQKTHGHRHQNSSHHCCTRKIYNPLK